MATQAGRCVGTLPGELWRRPVRTAGTTMLYELGRGWRVSVWHRHEGQPEQLCPLEVYDCLSPSEALDVLAAAMWLLLEPDAATEPLAAQAAALSGHAGLGQ